MRNDLFAKTYTAGGTVLGYRILLFSAAGVVAQASAATDASIGVAKGFGDVPVADEVSYATGDRVDVIRAGIAEVRYGGTVTLGALLTADANGKAIVATAAGQAVIGRAEVAGVENDIGSVFLSPGQLGVGA
jgi:hypothetical protein